MLHFLKRLLSRDRLWGMLIFLLIASGTLGFILVANIIHEGEPLDMDEEILLSLRVEGDTEDPIGPVWVEEAARDLTALGSMVVLGGFVLFLAIFHFLAGNARAAWILIITAVTGTILSTVLKESFDRQRPDLVAHQMEVMTKSFPSGHSLLSALVYLTAGTIATRSMPSRKLKAFVIFTAIFAAVIVGISRLYLGVHYPTDVLAGWCAGATWALLSWYFAQHYLGRDMSRKPSPNTTSNENEDG